MVGASYLNKNLNVLKKDGVLVLIGVMGGRYADKVDLQNIMIKRIKVTGSTMRSRSSDEKRIIADEIRHRILPLISMNKCLPVIDKIFRFEDVRLAHDYLDTGNHIGKVVLKIGS
jgi:NADPH:quinone reductase-like Zn-dependent oxidoreductase